MAQGQPFSAVGQVKLDATGAGEVTLSPPAVTWLVGLISINTTTNIKEPVFKLYRNGVSPTGFLEGSYSGSQDSSDSGHTIGPGESVIGVWSGGDANARATLRLSGTVG